MLHLRQKKFRTGVLLAPGEQRDYAMNMFVHEALKGRDDVAFAKKFKRSSASALDIEERLHQLVSAGCRSIFILGHQCKSAAISYLESGQIGGEIRFFLIDDPNTSRTDPISPFEVYQSESGAKLVAMNLLEYSAGRHLAKIVSTAIKGQEDQTFLAFLAGADVPVIQEFHSGLIEEHPWEQEGVKVIATTLGASYSKFSDAWSGYRITKYLIERYRITHLIQACGFSCRGVFRALSETPSERRPHLFNFDYPHWGGTLISDIGVEMSFTRKIDEQIIALSDPELSFEDAIAGLLSSTGVGEFVSHRREITDAIAECVDSDNAPGNYFSFREDYYS